LSAPPEEIATVSHSNETSGVAGQLLVQFKRLRSGDSGLIPIVVGLLILIIYFQTRNSAFLSASNLTNLSIQATVYVLLGMAEIWLLLLGEIDLSIGYLAALGGVVGTILVDYQYHWSWFIALPAAVLLTTGIGAIYGALVIRLRLPSFIVTLSGWLVLQGIVIYLIDHQGTGGSISIQESVLYDLVGGNLTPLATWLFIVVCVVGLAYLMIRTGQKRRAAGLEATPLLVTVVKIVLLAVVGVGLVWVFNTNRSTFVQLSGMPFAIPIDLAVLAVSTFILTKTRTGRYIYAIGGNKEAARRAGVNVNRYRFLAFCATGFVAGLAGLLYSSRLGGLSDSVDPTLTLYSIAAAVIGGTSLFGGRGKMVHALIGGLIIAVIYNGMALLSMSPPTVYMVTGLVLLAAVTIDSVARRGSSPLS
jgi:D-xylose transport system permease protein